jgi:hypothetical protein
MNNRNVFGAFLVIHGVVNCVICRGYAINYSMKSRKNAKNMQTAGAFYCPLKKGCTTRCWE